jgi:hypothetical protein
VSSVEKSAKCVFIDFVVAFVDTLTMMFGTRGLSIVNELILSVLSLEMFVEFDILRSYMLSCRRYSQEHRSLGPQGKKAVLLHHHQVMILNFSKRLCRFCSSISTCRKYWHVTNWKFVEI